MRHHYLRSKSSIFPFLTKASPTDGPTDGRTNRPTDRRTDRPSYRDAMAHLKNVNLRFFLFFRLFCVRAVSCNRRVQFLDASSHLYKRVCPSVHRSVRPSVGPSVGRSVTLLLHLSVSPSICLVGLKRTGRNSAVAGRVSCQENQINDFR